MPQKKKIQQKGKSKQANQDSEDYVFRRGDNDSTEEEYTTVADFEMKKYSKRLIESNWSKYEADPTNYRSSIDDNEPPKTNDLSDLLKIASSDCSYFQLNSEKLWKNENTVPASKIFNLDLNVLSSALACVPFHERIGLDESELSAEDKRNFDEAAEKSRKEYSLIREKMCKRSDNDSKNYNEENDLRTLGESIKAKLDLQTNIQVTEKNDKCLGEHLNIGELKKAENILKETDIIDGDTCDKVGSSKRKIFFGENDENLEDWLDSVLDD